MVSPNGSEFLSPLNTTIPSLVQEDEFLVASISRALCLELVPAYVYCALLMVFGIIGNVFVCLFYTRSELVSPTTRLIVALAIVDLVTCIQMPKHIVFMCRSYMGYSTSLCTTSAFFDFMTSLSSSTILVAIATFRFRAVCREFERPYTMRQTNIVIAGCLTTAGVLSVLSSLAHETTKVNLTEVEVNSGRLIHGYSCLISNDQDKKTLVFSIGIGLFVSFFATFVALVALYSIIGRKIYKHFKKKPNRSTSLTNLQDGNELLTIQSETPGVILEGTSVTNNDEVQPTDNKEATTVTYSSHTPHRAGDTLGRCRNSFYSFELSRVDSRPATSTATYDQQIPREVIMRVLMCFCISLVFVVSFLPVLAIFVHELVNSRPRNLYTTWRQIGIKSYLVNSAVNPIVYAVFNSAFRHFVWGCLCRFCRFLKCQKCPGRESFEDRDTA